MERTRILFLLFFTYYFGAGALNGQTIQGQIVDANDGSPLIGATLQWLTEGGGTLSDNEGFFVLQSQKDTLEVRYLGYQTLRFYPEQNNWQILRLQADELTTAVIPVVLDRRIHFATPQPFTSLPREVLWQDNGTTIVPALNQVPGVFVQSGALNTNRIVLRGIGSRNAFGTAKIRAFIDGIPLTNGTGETTIEDIDLSLLERVTVWKGPSASHLGASLGGVIQLETKTLQSRKGSFVNNTFTAGSYGLLRNVVQAKFQSKDGKTTIFLNQNITHSDGYRENNEYNRQSNNVLVKLDGGNNHQFTILGSYIDLESFIPSSLNEDDFLNDPRKAAFTWAQVRGFEDVERALFGVRHHFSKDNWQIQSNVYTNWQENYELRPFGILNEASRAVGLRSKGTYYFSDQLNLSLGGEYYRERYNGATYEQVGREIGRQESDQEQLREYVNVFTELKGHIEKFHWEIGLNLNQTNYELQDLYAADSIDQSGNYAFDLIVSPRLGLSYSFGTKAMLYTLLSHGFSAPTIAETLTPEGLVNTDIQPERGWNTELGLRGRLLEERLQYDLAFYRMSVKDLLVARRVGQDEFVGVNAGKTLHQGIEAYLSYQWPQGIQLQASYTFSDYEFKDFMDLDEDYSGNPLTGVAPHVFHLTASWQARMGYYLQTRFQYVDAMPLRDDASVYSDAYSLLHLQTGYRKTFGQHFSLDAALGVNNVLDELYASMVLINAASFGGSAPRYYYPGVARNWYLRVGLRYNW